MKRFFKFVTMLLLIVLLSGCEKNDNSDDGAINNDLGNGEKIVVTCRSWNGWDANYKSDDEIFEYTVSVGDIIIPDNKNIADQIEFEIMSVTNESVIIKTSRSMSCNKVEDTTINLNSKETKFEVKKGEKIKLTTLTMDCGDIYIIEY